MNNTEAFVYCWTDKVTGMLYIGSHKGTPDDGYICSSKRVMNEYKKRKQDFVRQIVSVGSLKDMRKFEAILLQKLNAAADPKYYNLHNCDEKFLSDTSKMYEVEGILYKGLTDIAKKFNITKSAVSYRVNSKTIKYKNWNYAGQVKTLAPPIKRPDLSERNRKGLSEKTKEKLRGPRPSISGKNNPMYGKTHDKDVIEKIKSKIKASTRKSHKVTEETKEKMSLARKSYWQNVKAKNGN